MILKIEKGHRPLRLTEAEALAKISRVELTWLISAEEDVHVQLATDRASPRAGGFS